MIFDVAWLVSHISRRTTLLPGGIVTTGTPSGVGMRMTPPLYLVPGDVMRLGIAGLGEQRQEVSRVTDTPRPVPPRCSSGHRDRRGQHGRASGGERWGQNVEIHGVG